MRLLGITLFISESRLRFGFKQLRMHSQQEVGRQQNDVRRPADNSYVGLMSSQLFRVQ